MDFLKFLSPLAAMGPKKAAGMGLFGLGGFAASGGFGGTPPQLPDQNPGMPPPPPSSGAPSAQFPTFGDNGPGLRPLPPKAASPFDKANRAQTFAQIAQQFAAGKDFASGAAGAAGAIADRRSALLKGPQSTLGGPDNSFRIITDAQTGEQSYEAVPEFEQYNQRKREGIANLRNTPGIDEAATARGSVMSTIAQLPPEQRAAAYSNFLASKDTLGYGQIGFPAAWDDATANVLGGASITPYQRSEMARRAAGDEHSQTIADGRLGNATRNTASIIQKRNMPAPPPSVRRGRRNSPNDDLSYLGN
jgi:hypothetical protein